MNDRIKEITDYFNGLLDDIENMQYYENKFICLFTIIDSMAQNYGNYSRKNEKMFSDFILKFADKNIYGYLDEVDPITLIYHDKNQILRISALPKATILNPNSEAIKNVRLKALKNINNLTLISKHKYITLLYKFRSKVIHEGSSGGLVSMKTENENYNSPIYLDKNKYYELIFPYKFLKELVINCIRNYLNYCKSNNLDPFYNNDDSRLSHHDFY